MLRKLFFILLATMLAAVPAAAQKGLSIADHFGGRYADRSDVTEIHIKGAQLKQHGISLFRSLKMPGAVALAADIERSVKADAAAAIDETVVSRGARIRYGIYEFKPERGLHRFIFFRNDAAGGKKDGWLTLVYIEGTADRDAITRRFGTK